MNFVALAIRHLKLEIPDEILDMAFSQQANFSLGYSNRSTDSFIEKTLIKEMFIEDIGLYLGPTVRITVKPEWVTTTADSRTLFRVPMEVTNNRRILAIMELYHGPADLPVATGFSTMTAPYGFSHGTNANSQVLAGSAAILNSQLGGISIGTSDLEIVDINTILYHGLNRMVAPCTLVVKLELDAELRGITIQYQPLLANVFIEFVKSVIYQRLSIKIDKSAIMGGQSMGKIVDFVESYSDAGKNYREMLTTLVVKLATLASPAAKRNWNRSMIGIG